MNAGETPARSRRGWRRPGVIALGLAGLVAGVAGLAWAAGVGPQAFGNFHCRGALGRDFVEYRIHKALKAVAATDAQEQQIMGIVDGLFAQHQAMEAVHQEMHQRAVSALTGDTVDRAALEAIRVDAVQRIDAGSKTLVKAIGDIAEVLTPEQRAQLAEMAKAHFE